MIFDAKCQSFKILVFVFGLVGATFVADCHAERNPISLSNKSYCLDLLRHETDSQFDTGQQIRRQNEKQWAEFKQFVSGKAATLNRKLASLNLQDWLQHQNGENETPNEKPSQINRTESIAISPSTMLLRSAANVTIVQYWLVGNRTADLARTVSEQVDQASLKLQDDFRISLIQLTKSSATNLNMMAIAPRVIKPVANNLSDVSDQMDIRLVATVESANHESSSDPYWGYYSDCDHWGAKLINSDD